MLKIEQLTFSYKMTKHEVRKGADASSQMVFNLDVNAGEILSLIGPSGSGKSTLLDLIAGFKQPSAGKILLNNNDIIQQSIVDRPVTTVFQEHNLFPHLDVFSNVALGIKPSLKLTQDETRGVHQALESVGLAGYSKRQPAQLSGGQRQRVALARALVREHKVLLLDEPLAALGPAMRDEIIDLIKNIVQEKRIMALLVSHQPSDALRASKRTAFINAGEMLAIDTTDTMINHSPHQAIQNYLGQL